MRRSVSKVLDYLVLSFLVSAAIVSILIFNGNHNFQLLTVIGLSILYIIWGLIHHIREGTMNSKIIFEYIAFAVLGSALVIGLF